MVPMVVSTTESKSSNSTAPGTELVVAPGLMVTEMAFAGLTASRHPAAASAALSFDFIVKPLSTNHRSRHERRFQDNHVNRRFLDNRNVQKKASFYGRVLDQ